MLLNVAFFTVYLALCLTLSWQDIRYGLLPDRFTCPLLWSGLVWFLCSQPQQLPDAVWGAIGGYLGFATVYWGYRLVRRREGLGYGDVKFLAALGAWHGWQLLPQLVMIATLLACSLVLVSVIRRGSLQGVKKPLPFGPFLAAAGLIILVQMQSRAVIIPP